MFNFVSLLKYKRQMTGNKLCKPAQVNYRALQIRVNKFNKRSFFDVKVTLPGNPC